MLQHSDPHHFDQDPNNIYYFIVIGLVLVGVVLFFFVKVMTALERRPARPRKREDVEIREVDD